MIAVLFLSVSTKWSPLFQIGSRLANLPGGGLNYIVLSSDIQLIHQF